MTRHACKREHRWHFQKLDVYQRTIEFVAVANRIRVQLPRGNADLADQLRGSAMECASHLDVMKIDELIENVAMLTKLVDP